MCLGAYVHACTTNDVKVGIRKSSNFSMKDIKILDSISRLLALIQQNSFWLNLNQYPSIMSLLVFLQKSSPTCHICGKIND